MLVLDCHLIERHRRLRHQVHGLLRREQRQLLELHANDGMSDGFSDFLPQLADEILVCRLCSRWVCCLLTRFQHLCQRFRIGQTVIATDLDQRRCGQPAVLDEFKTVVERNNIVLS